MIFCEKILAKIKISLHRSVEKLGSHKRYFCLFVCLGAFISEIELPRIPTYLLKKSPRRLPPRVLAVSGYSRRQALGANDCILSTSVCRKNFGIKLCVQFVYLIHILFLIYMFVKQKECRLYSCHKPLDFPACEVKHKT